MFLQHLNGRQFVATLTQSCIISEIPLAVTKLLSYTEGSIKIAAFRKSGLRLENNTEIRFKDTWFHMTQDTVK
jgi:hypothetical protein